MYAWKATKWIKTKTQLYCQWVMATTNKHRPRVAPCSLTSFMPYALLGIHVQNSDNFINFIVQEWRGIRRDNHRNHRLPERRRQSLVLLLSDSTIAMRVRRKMREAKPPHPSLPEERELSTASNSIIESSWNLAGAARQPTSWKGRNDEVSSCRTHASKNSWSSWPRLLVIIVLMGVVMDC